jgi:Na+/H+ antiporter NhaC
MSHMPPPRGTSCRIRSALLPAGLLIGLLCFVQPAPAAASVVEIETPSIILSGIPYDVAAVVETPVPPGTVVRLEVRRGDTGRSLEARPDPETGRAVFRGLEAEGFGRVEHSAMVTAPGSAPPPEGTEVTRTIRVIPGILSVLPPLLAILMALLFRQVVLALVAGIWLGALFLNDLNPVSGFLRIIDHYIVESLAGADSGRDNTSIFLFTLLLGGMVGVFTRMGGTRGMVNLITRLATNARRGQLATWLMGVFIFFDDYTNTLIVGNTMRPITDRLRISREKLSYLVDSTAAPVTSLAIITSWIGFEISLIAGAFDTAGVDRNPFGFLLRSLPYSFYPILALVFVLLVSLTGRDFGPMLRAERRARRGGKVHSDQARPLSDIDSSVMEAPEGIPHRWWNAVIPILVVVTVTLVGLVVTGGRALGEGGAGADLLDRIKEGNSFTALLWASLTGCLVAILLAVGQRLLSVTGALDAWVNGIRSMLPAILILVLAWSIALVCDELRTADYLIHRVQGFLSPYWLPALVFVIAMAVSFSTGTSWGTLSILTPIVIPLAVRLLEVNAVPANAAEPILLASTAGILSGAVFGDHCSPISDTTIMSSMASAADHVDHVRTQLPYAVLVAVLSLLFGVLPAVRGVPPFVGILAGTLVAGLVLRFAGARSEA